MGFVAGVYIFFASRLPIEPTGPTQETKGFEVIADMYGGCARIGCASYRIENNGSYLYMVRNVNGEDLRFEDQISSKRANELGELIVSEDFKKLAESTFTGTCPTAYDGVAFRFTIRQDGVSHLIDTCEHDTEGSDVITELVDYFSILALTHDVE